jgi:5-methylcytosine-specific restriction endonuclease McrA
MRVKSKTICQRWNKKCKCYFLDLMSDDKKRRTIYLHKEVANLYVPNDDETIIMIIHKDNNPRNNRAENFLWMTASQHMKW